MQPKEFQKEMFNLMKSGLESYLQTLKIVQEQNEKIVELMMTQGEAVHEETKKMLQQWIEAGKKAQSQYMDAMQKSLEKMEAFIHQKI